MSATSYTLKDFGPSDLLTSSKEGFRRVRVDVAQTGFFEGREFRTFYEFDIPQGQAVTGRFYCPVDFILFQQSLSVDSGAIRLTALAGASPSGVFDTSLPVIGKNRMASRATPYYEAQSTISIGGSASGGQVVEVARIVAANSTAQQSTVGGQIADERGLPAGEYFIVLENISNGPSTGVYNVFWEERP